MHMPSYNLDFYVGRKFANYNDSEARLQDSSYNNVSGWDRHISAVNRIAGHNMTASYILSLRNEAQSVILFEQVSLKIP